MSQKILRALAITLLCFFGIYSSASATPSYIGPYRYYGVTNEAITPGFNNSYATEDEAIAAAPKAMYFGPTFCNIHFWSSNLTDWNAKDVYYGKIVEGVEASAIRGTWYYQAGVTLSDGLCHGSSPTPTGNWQIVRWRTVCSSTQRYFDGKCVNITWLNLPGMKGANQGPTCSTNGTHSCGEPINTATGNMWHIEKDFADRLGGNLFLKRTYNSQIFEPVRSNLFGNRWTVAYDARLIPVAAVANFVSQKCYQRTDNNQMFCESSVTSDSLASAPAIEVSRGDGKFYVFNLSGGIYKGDKDTNDELTARKSVDGTIIGFDYKDAQAGTLESFDTNGRLLAISTRAGVVHRLTYTIGTTNDSQVGRYPADAPPCRISQDGDIQPAGRLACVTDDWGRQDVFKYDLAGRVVEFIDPAGHSYMYEYDGPTGGCIPANASSAACKASNLTKVTYPDGAVKQYVYNEASNINWGSACEMPSIGNGFGPFVSVMTGLIDELNVRYISWFYNCRGQAKVSTFPGNVNRVDIGFYQSSYGVASYSQVISTTGPASASTQVTSTFTPTLVLDVYKNGGIDAPCTVCGPIRARTFDANGNVASTTDFGGNVTKYTYDLIRNLETSRVEASGTASARTITTVWHPTLRLPVTIAQPKIITTLTYDANGNVLTRTEQATSDVSGSSGAAAALVGPPRNWTYTYNRYGQVLSVVGPRTDIVDKTTYDYDAQGNLAVVTNPLGQTTTYSDYDDNGNVGRIVGPNGLVTEFTYTPRGRIASRTVSDKIGREATSFEYDPVGQMVKQINPDGSWMAFGYDPAHRLISVNDNVGNSIAYTLDLTGNRISEQVSDPAGTLKRQVARVFNTLGQMTKVTGAAQ
ncbi:RHS repeat protein [Massilia sp. TW-1]|uniref:RHS repeat protein n=2 Tax=Telluria antibiotica TaxID=2717319 RepID=A0ABX0PBI4_9BURK|nr:RHS repeat protein [Telluria antibiotica]